MRVISSSHDRVADGVLSVAIAMLALGCTALPFVPPSMCGMVAMTVSVGGSILAIRGVVRHRLRWANLLCVLGSIFNLIVVLIASQVWGSKTHLIDRLERDSGWLLGFVCIAPFIAVLLTVGLLIRAKLRRS